MAPVPRRLHPAPPLPDPPPLPRPPPRQTVTSLREIGPAEYDTAAHLLPACCPLLSVAADARPAADLLAGFEADRRHAAAALRSPVWARQLDLLADALAPRLAAAAAAGAPPP